MRFLLDTHILVWAALHPERLSKQAQALITDNRNQLIFSSISVFEVTIKAALGRPDFAIDPVFFRNTMLEIGYDELGFSSDHALAVQRLPLIHKDPFDRALLAQALFEEVTLVSVDKAMWRYPVPMRQV